MTSTVIPLHPHAPEWFRAALAVPFVDGNVVVDGATIHYLAWGEPGRPGLVFVHGGAAHAHWWTHIAAAFADDWRVVAVDLSGHGDSDHRVDYDIAQWGREVIAAAAHAHSSGPLTIVGHSLGGIVTAVAAATHPDAVDRIVVLDSPLGGWEPQSRPADSDTPRSAMHRPSRPWDSVEVAVEKFRTLPPQERYLDYVRDHVARRSLKRVDGGYDWKFHRRMLGDGERRASDVAGPYLPQLICELTFLRCERGVITDEMVSSISERTGRPWDTAVVRGAAHHAMLDEPLALRSALEVSLRHAAVGHRHADGRATRNGGER